MSQKQVPLLHEVIPIIDILTEKLKDAIKDDDLTHLVKGGAVTV
jgi:hypothetical protein